jgi:hypothetical protein
VFGAASEELQKATPTDEIFGHPASSESLYPCQHPTRLLSKVYKQTGR